MIRNLKKKLFSWLLESYKRRKQNQAITDIDYCLKVTKSMISSGKYGFFISNGNDGWCSTRLVQPIVDGEFVIWIGTNPNLRKVTEVAENSKVTFAYQDTKQKSNLVIYGHATIESNLQLRKKYWKEEWKLFFPGGPESEDYVLIRIEALKIELMNFAKNIVPEPFGLKPVVIEKENGTWSIA